MVERKIHKLVYDKKKWQEKIAKPVATLQLFITNRCNLRCKGCFYGHKLGQEDMSFNDYKRHVTEHLILAVKKIIILGGEPMLHEDICQMINWNSEKGLKTTIYTNGLGIEKLAQENLSRCDVRIGVYGLKSSERPLVKIKKPAFPVTYVYMLRKDNVDELLPAAKEMEANFNGARLFISCIRDILKTQNYWTDTDEILTFDDYFSVVQNFVDSYNGNMEIHIARRGVIETDIPQEKVQHCRFGNIFPNGEKIICPFDISRNTTTDKLVFGIRPCNKNNECLLRKIVLERKTKIAKSSAISPSFYVQYALQNKSGRKNISRRQI